MDTRTRVEKVAIANGWSVSHADLGSENDDGVKLILTKPVEGSLLDTVQITVYLVRDRRYASATYRHMASAYLFNSLGGVQEVPSIDGVIYRLENS